MRDQPIQDRRPIFWGALRAALGRIPLWFICWGVPLLAALVVALPWKDWFAESLAHGYAPKSVLGTMSETFRFDQREALSSLRVDSGIVASSLAVLAIVFGVFAAGGWLQVFLERTSGHTVRRFLWGGARYFWRFSRVLILTAIGLVLVWWVFKGWVWRTLLELLFGAKDGNLEVLESELSAVWMTWLQDGATAVSLALLLIWGDYTRTRMALHNSHSSIWAGLCTFFLLILHPVRTLRPFLLILLIEIAVIWVLGQISWGINTGLDVASGWKSVLWLFLIGQIALMWQSISRGARYSAAVQISRQLVPPLSQPDPWASRVGPPGGPQYPIDDTDDYGVSI